jgi:hypothetical protein
MKNTLTFILAVLILLFGIALFTGKHERSTPTSPPEAVATKNGHTDARVPTVHPRISTRQISENRQGQEYDEHEVRGTQAFKIHKAVHQFLASPARDSLEIRLILKKLRDRGYGIECLFPVYEAAWHVRAADPAYSHPLDHNRNPITNDSPGQQGLREGMKRDEMSGLINGRHGFKIPDEEFASELLDIRPKLPLFDLSSLSGKRWNELNAPPQMGEAFLTEADLDRYLTEHPPKDTENWFGPGNGPQLQPPAEH